MERYPIHRSHRPRQHWHECWRYASHHACAVAEVERLRAALEEVLDAMFKRDWSVAETAARGALGEEAANGSDT